MYIFPEIIACLSGVSPSLFLAFALAPFFKAFSTLSASSISIASKR